MKRAGDIARDRLAELAKLAPSEEDVARAEAQRAREARAASGRLYSDAFTRSLPEGLRHAATGPYEEDQGNRAALRAADALAPTQSLLLHGQPGLGKTHLAVRTAYRLSREHGLKAHFWVWPELVARLRDWRNTDRVPSITGPDILVIDDFDKGAVTEFVYERAYDVLQRVFRRQSTIVTSNRSPAKTAMRFGMGDQENTEAFISRFRLFRSAALTGRDRRPTERR